jgi:hypothetical protein
MSRTIYCAGCQTVIRVVSDDDPHRQLPAFCRECVLKKARNLAETQGISNDSIGAKRGAARAHLLALLPKGAQVFTLQVNQQTNASGDYSPIFEYFVFALHEGAPVLLNGLLRELGRFGVNRRRGTIRTNEKPAILVAHLAIRLYGDPQALASAVIANPAL